MDANTTVDLDQLHVNIVAAIAAAFPGLATVEAYREEDERSELVTPACLIELAELEAAPDADPGTEQLAMTAKFEALVLVGFREANAKRQVRRLAAALSHFILRKRWDLPVGPAQVIGAFRDEFDPRLDQFEVWRVEWQQVVHIGDSVWNADGVTPTLTPLYAWSPRIGPPFKDEYRTLPGRPPITE